MNRIYVFIQIVLLCCSSCSLFIKETSEVSAYYPILPAPAALECLTAGKTSAEWSQHHTLKTPSEYVYQLSQEIFTKLARAQVPLANIDQIVILTLLQMKTHPYVVSPTATLQLIEIPKKGAVNYWKFGSQEEQKLQDSFRELDQEYHPLYSFVWNEYKKKSMEKIADIHEDNYIKKDHQIPFPLFYGLETLLKQHQSRYTLRELARIVDAKQGQVEVDVLMQDFLKTHEATFHNMQLKKLFLKDGETLEKGDRLPPLSIEKLVEFYHQRPPQQLLNGVAAEQLYSIQRNLPYSFNMSEIKGQEDQWSQDQFACNWNIARYKKRPQLIDKYHYTGQEFFYQDEKSKNAFMVFIHQDYSQTLSLMIDEENYLFFGHAYPQDLPICEWKATDKHPAVFMASLEGRDPGQHLYHFLQSLDSFPATTQVWDEKLRYPRYLYLHRPPRIILESSRVSSEKMAQLLENHYAFYHATYLGHLWMFKQGQLQMDDRKTYYSSCQKER